MEGRPKCQIRVLAASSTIAFCNPEAKQKENSFSVVLNCKIEPNCCSGRKHCCSTILVQLGTSWEFAGTTLGVQKVAGVWTGTTSAALLLALNVT
jgi:hypothetical protein